MILEGTVVLPWGTLKCHYFDMRKTTTRRDRMQQMTLPGRYFTDPAVFREEIEATYYEAWVWTGRAETIRNAGDFFVRDVAGESIIVTRGSDHEVRAFYNVCRHRGTRICMESDGRFSGRIQCPYHGWTYSLEGRLLGAPHMDKSRVPP